MRIPERRERFVPLCEYGQVFNDGSRFFKHDFARAFHRDNVLVVADVTARRAEVNYGRGVRTLKPVRVNVAHNVVTDFLFARFGNVVIYIVHVRFEFGDLRLGHVKSEFMLGAGKRDPEPPPRGELEVVRKAVLHFVACVAGR